MRQYIRQYIRVPRSLLNELIENEGELRTGPINEMGILRLALDLKDAIKEIEIWHKYAKAWRGMTDKEIKTWIKANKQ